MGAGFCRLGHQQHLVHAGGAGPSQSFCAHPLSTSPVHDPEPRVWGPCWPFPWAGLLPAKASACTTSNDFQVAFDITVTFVFSFMGGWCGWWAACCRLCKLPCLSLLERPQGQGRLELRHLLGPDS